MWVKLKINSEVYVVLCGSFFDKINRIDRIGQADE